MQKGQFSASPCACNWDQSAGSAAAVPPELNKGDVIFPGLLPYAIAPALPGAASAALPHAALGSVSGKRMRQSPVTAALEVLSVSRKRRCIRKKKNTTKIPQFFFSYGLNSPHRSTTEPGIAQLTNFAAYSTLGTTGLEVQRES